MNAIERVNKRSMLRFRLCPDCPLGKRGFNYPGEQHEHAEATGHRRVEDCAARHRRTRRFCEREAGHKGQHGYLGAYYLVWF